MKKILFLLITIYSISIYPQQKHTKELSIARKNEIKSKARKAFEKIIDDGFVSYNGGYNRSKRNEKMIKTFINELDQSVAINYYDTKSKMCINPQNYEEKYSNEDIVDFTYEEKDGSKRTVSLKNSEFSTNKNGESISFSLKNGLTISKDEIKLIDAPNAKVNIKNSKINVNPKFDFFIKYESSNESSDYFQKLLDNSNYTFDIAQMRESIKVAKIFKKYNEKYLDKIGIFNYTDLGFDSEINLNVKSHTNLGNIVDLYSYEQFFLLGYVPMKAKVDLKLRTTVKAFGKLNVKMPIKNERDNAVGVIYDFSNKNNPKLKSKGFTSVETIINKEIKGEVLTHLKVELVMTVELQAAHFINGEAWVAPSLNSETSLTASLNGNQTSDLSFSSGIYASATAGVKLSIVPILSSNETELFKKNLDESYFGRYYLYRQPESIKILSGENQSGVPGIKLSEKIDLKVYDKFKSPLKGFPIKYYDSGLGRSSAKFTTTNNTDGKASIDWSPHNATSRLIVEVNYTEVDDSNFILKAKKVNTISKEIEYNYDAKETALITINEHPTLPVCGGNVNKLDQKIYFNIRSNIPLKSLQSISINGIKTTNITRLENLRFDNFTNIFKYKVSLPGKIKSKYKNDTTYKFSATFITELGSLVESKAGKIYFIDGTSTIPPELKLSIYHKPISNSVEKLGIIRDAEPTVTTIDWDSNFKRKDAVKALVVLGLKHGIIPEIYDKEDVGFFKDIKLWDNTHNFPLTYKKYVQTLLKYGAFDHIPKSNRYGSFNFRGDDVITLENFSTWIVNFFKLRTNNSTFKTFDFPDANTCKNEATNLITNLYYLDDQNRYIQVFSGGIFNKNADIESICSNTLKFPVRFAARFLDGIDKHLEDYPSEANYNYRKTNEIQSQKNIANFNKWNIVGEMLNTTGKSKSKSNSNIKTSTIHIKDNETKLFPKMPLNNNGVPIFYYWAVKGGVLNSLTKNHNHVEFIPPKVTNKTTFKLYVRITDVNGRYADGLLNIVVSPSEKEQSVQCSDAIISNINEKLNYDEKNNNYDLNLSWKETQELDYVVNIRKSNRDFIRSSEIKVSDNKATFKNLTACTDYVVEIKPSCKGLKPITYNFSTGCKEIKGPISINIVPFSQKEKLDITTNLEKNTSAIYLVKPYGDGQPFKSPKNFKSYSDNINYQDAPKIENSSTRVLDHSASELRRRFSGFEWGKKYIIRVYAYTGRGSAKIYSNDYKEKVFEIKDFSVSDVDFSWFVSPIVTGENVGFYGDNNNSYYEKWYINGELKHEGVYWGAIFEKPGKYSITFEKCDILNKKCIRKSKEITVISPDQNKPIIEVKNEIKNISNQYSYSYDMNIKLKNIGFDGISDFLAEHYLVSEPSLNENQKYYYKFPNNNPTGPCQSGIYQNKGMEPGDFRKYHRILCLSRNSLPDYGKYYIAIKFRGTANNVANWDGNLGVFYFPIKIEKWHADIEPTALISNKLEYQNNEKFDFTLKYKSNANNWTPSNFITFDLKRKEDNKIIQTFYDGSPQFHHTEGVEEKVLIKEDVSLTIQEGEYYLEARVKDEYTYNDEVPFITSGNNIVKSESFYIKSETQPKKQVENLVISEVSNGKAKVTFEKVLGVDKYLVVANKDKYNYPKDGTRYSSNNNWEKGEEFAIDSKIIYYGDNNFVNVTNLPQEDEIIIKVFSANEINNKNIDYLQGYGFNNDFYKGYNFLARKKDLFAKGLTKISNRFGGQFIQKSDGEFIAIGSNFIYSSKEKGKYFKFYRQRNINGFMQYNKAICILNNDLWVVSNNKLMKNVLDLDDFNNIYDFNKNNIEIHQIKFLTKKEGYAIGVKPNKINNNNDLGVILKTLDGGESWKLIHTIESKYGFYNAQIKNGIIALVSKNGLSYSKNNGNNWEFIEKEADYNSDIYIKNNNIYLVNTKGEVFIENIDGLNLITKLPIKKESYSNEIFVDDKGIFVLTDGVIYYSNTFDNNFKVLLDDNNLNIESFGVLDDNRIILGANGMYILNYDFCSDIKVKSTTISNKTLCKGQSVKISLQGNFDSETQFILYNDIDRKEILATSLTPDFTITPNETETYYIEASSKNCSVPQFVKAGTVTVTNTLPEIVLKGNETIRIKCNEKYIELGAIAKDECDGDLTSKVEIDSFTNTGLAGTYYVKYSVKDSSGNVVEKFRKVIVEKIENLQFVLNGDDEVILECGQNYTELGAIAIDGCIGDISNRITIKKEIIDNDHYKIIYSISNNGVKKIKIRDIYIRDTKNPIINILGSSEITLNLNSSYEELGYWAYDNCDSEVNKKIKIDSNLNTSKEGVYKVNYRVSDTEGNTSKVTRIVNVVNQDSLGVENIKTNNFSATLFPNPASDIINIKTDNHLIKSYKIYDINGTLLLEKSNSNNQIDISLLNSGVYIVLMESEIGNKIFQKVIKK